MTLGTKVLGTLEPWQHRFACVCLFYGTFLNRGSVDPKGAFQYGRGRNIFERGCFGLLAGLLFTILSLELFVPSKTLSAKDKAVFLNFHCLLWNGILWCFGHALIFLQPASESKAILLLSKTHWKTASNSALQTQSKNGTYQIYLQLPTSNIKQCTACFAKLSLIQSKSETELCLSGNVKGILPYEQSNIIMHSRPQGKTFFSRNITTFLSASQSTHMGNGLNVQDVLKLSL